MIINKETELKYVILKEIDTNIDLKFRVIVIGKKGVGKTCLTIQATRKKFEDKPTEGFDHFAFNMKIGEKIIQLNIWDTCRQDIYKSLIPNYYRNSSLAIIVYAINE